jgi:hypothetical protein
LPIFFCNTGPQDDDLNPSPLKATSKLTCKTSAAGSTGKSRAFRAPYTLIRNGSSRKSRRTASSGLRVLCQESIS